MPSAARSPHRVIAAALLATLASGAALSGPTTVVASGGGDWRALVGTSGLYGMVTLRDGASGSGSLDLQLLRLPPATVLATSLRTGTCSSTGLLIATTTSTRTSTTGAAVRVISLGATAAAKARAAAASASRLSVRVQVGRAVRCGVFARVVAQRGILGRAGAELVLNGAPFHDISFDKFDLLQQYVFTTNGAWEHDLQHGVPAAEKALRELGAHGFRVIRVDASPFYPAWFNDVFFDPDPARQAQKRREYFAAFDQMLDACDRHGIRIVATLVWNIENLADLGHHSLHEGITNPRALGRVRIAEYVRAVVLRYRDRPTIAIWELGNEWNLLADLQYPVSPSGYLQGTTAGDPLHPGPVVRDARNNFSSDELATYYAQMATLIRAVDARHLITTGDSSPRPSAMHLLEAARAGRPTDWTPDSRDEMSAYIRLVNPDPIDAMSIHYGADAMTAFGGALGSVDNLRFFAGAASAMEKPLVIGEIYYGDAAWDSSDEGLAELRAQLAAIVDLKIPLSLFWAFADDRQLGDGDGSLRYGRSDAALRLIRAAALQIRT